MNRAEAMRLAAAALADRSPQEDCDGDLIVSLSDNNRAEGAAELAGIRRELAAIGPGYSADWTGGGNSDADGEQTSDVSITWPGEA